MNDSDAPLLFQIGLNAQKSCALSAEELSTGWMKHRTGDPFTKFLEDYSQSFTLAGLPDEEALLFVRMVCAWGGLRGKNFQLFRESVAMLQQNGRSLGSLLRQAKNHSEQGKFQEAIIAFDGLKGLGVSFRSKILRFLCPDSAAILDSIISDRLGYRNSAKGYEAFVTDCIGIRDRLNQKKCPHPLERPWQTTDVEMGVFTKVKDPT